MTKNELFLLSSCITALSSQPDAQPEINTLLSSLFDNHSQKADFSSQSQKKNSPSGKKHPGENFKGFIKFNKKELAMLPKSFQLYFIHNNEIVSYRFHRGMYHARYFKHGHHIEVASVDFSVMKQKFIDAYNAEAELLEASSQPKPKTKSVLFGPYGESWLKLKQQTTKPSTFKEYSRLFYTNLNPAFNEFPLTNINRSVVQDYLFGFIGQQKFRTAEKLKLQLTCIFDMAYEDFNIPSPMTKIVLPFYEPLKGSAFSKAEEKTLVDYCRNHPASKAASALLILLFFGLRQSELASMKVIDNTWLEVETSKELLGRNTVIRRVPFTPMVKQNLSYIDFQTAAQTKQRTIASALRRLFPNHHPHELRYTYITRCKECGVNPKVVMLWDGHEADKDVKASRVDRGYTDFSEDYLLKEALKVEYALE